MHKHKIEIVKASGETVTFDPKKLQYSLERAGASPEQIERIMDEVEQELYDGISTSDIYGMAFDKLKQISRGLAARYKLKHALMELGPTGYPFEKYVGEVLKHQGYEVEINQMVEGYCVSHEVDIIAKNEENRYLIECKFHNRNDTKSDVKVPLYIHSRFNDIHRQWERDPGIEQSFKQGWVVTNTRFSEDALNYGTCVGLRMISWDQPGGNGLKRMIELARLYPITCLNSLSKTDKKRLLEQEIVLCREIHREPEFLSQTNIKSSKHSEIQKEVGELCNDHSDGASSR